MRKIHNNKQVLEYWEKEEVESMYDKYIINLEIRIIKKRIIKNSKVLDVGCGEGEGTLEYSSVPGVKITAIDFSTTRLRKATERLGLRRNVVLKKIDLLKNYSLGKNFDIIVSQRFLINLMEWDLQKKVLLDLKPLLKKGGKLLMLEGSMDGVSSLNNFRKLFGLEPIPVKWHNLFFEDKKLRKFMEENNFRLVEEDGLGEYFMLTRGVRPYFEKNLDWNVEFNKIASGDAVKELLCLKIICSRLKLWVFEKMT